MDEKIFVFKKPAAAIFTLFKVFFEEEIRNNGVVNGCGFGDGFENFLMVDSRDVVDVVEARIGGGEMGLNLLIRGAALFEMKKIEVPLVKFGEGNVRLEDAVKRTEGGIGRKFRPLVKAVEEDSGVPQVD